jgi:hypothetical protein
MFGLLAAGMSHPAPSPEGEGLFSVTLVTCKLRLFRGGVGMEHIMAKKANTA